jgi:hypothetical protein
MSANENQAEFDMIAREMGPAPRPIKSAATPEEAIADWRRRAADGCAASRKVLDLLGVA